MATRVERIEFPGAGGAPLAARLELPDGEPVAWALFAHCFTCSKESFAATRIGAALAAHGVAVLRFDFTGLGGSGGDFANTDFSSNVEDLLAAAAHLRATRRAPRLLVGHSLGGTAVLAAAGRIPEVTAVVTINAPAEPAHLRRLLADSLDAIERDGEAAVAIGGRTFRITRRFLDDLSQQRMDEAIASLGRALLVLHAPEDEVVSADDASRIFAAARHPKSLVALPGADHLLTRREDARYAADVLAVWAARYLGGGAAREDGRDVLPSGVVTVEETGAGRFAERVRAGRHVLAADEPVEAGGTDTGPGPYDYLLAALGSCTAMTLRLYAERKGWPLARVSVRLRHDRIHAVDCRDCETKEGSIDHIERTLHLEGALDDAQRARLLEIADRCPVHRTLVSEISIVTRAE